MVSRDCGQRRPKLIQSLTSVRLATAHGDGERLMRGMYDVRSEIVEVV